MALPPGGSLSDRRTGLLSERRTHSPKRNRLAARIRRRQSIRGRILESGPMMLPTRRRNFLASPRATGRGRERPRVAPTDRSAQATRAAWPGGRSLPRLTGARCLVRQAGRLGGVRTCRFRPEIARTENRRLRETPTERRWNRRRTRRARCRFCRRPAANRTTRVHRPVMMMPRGRCGKRTRASAFSNGAVGGRSRAHRPSTAPASSTGGTRRSASLAHERAGRRPSDSTWKPTAGRPSSLPSRTASRIT
jgi:hypothetical protein